MMYYNNYGGNFSEGIREGIKNSFRKGSSLTRLIYINCGIFSCFEVDIYHDVVVGERRRILSDIAGMDRRAGRSGVFIEPSVDDLHLYVYSVRFFTSVVQYVMALLVREFFPELLYGT